MEKVIIFLALSLSGFLQAQTSYEPEMKQAFRLWEDGKTQEASIQFEFLAQNEPHNWLPNYYVALVNTTEAFETRDPVKFTSLLGKAQGALDKEMEKGPLNVELLILQAMIHTARIANDPMTYGQTLSPVVWQLYKKAESIDPNNPRLVYSKARFEFGTAQFKGTDLQPICNQIEQSLDLFNNFKPESPFHPNWGKQQAEETLKNCK